MVSVIIPVYNAEKYIGACIESVINQGADVEIIAVDDGSCDESGRIIKEYAKRYGNIHYFYKDNSGVSAARNYGMEKSSGVYIMFADADDMLPANAVNRLRSAIEEKQVDAVFGNHSYMYPDRIVERFSRLDEGKYSAESLKGTIIDDGTMTGMLLGGVWGAIYKREIIDKGSVRFCEDIKRNEDGIFNLKYVMESRSIYVIAEPSVYLYRQWKETKASKLEIDAKTRAATKRIIELADGRMSEDALRLQLKRRRVSMVFWDCAKLAGKNVTYREAKEFLKPLFEEEGFAECIESLDYTKINRYKRVMSHLMMKKRYLLFYIAMHCVYPALVNRVKR